MPIHGDSTVTAMPRVGRAIMEYRLDPGLFIASLVLPRIFTGEQSGQIQSIKRESISSRSSVKRAPGSTFSRDDIELQGVDYKCISRGHEAKLPDENRAHYDSLFNAYRFSAQRAAWKIGLDQEIDTKDLLFDTTLFTGAALFKDNSGAPWSTAGTDIVSQVHAAKEKVVENCGMEANSIVFGRAQKQNLIKNTDLKARLGANENTTPAKIMNLLSDVFELDVFIGGGIYNSADEGQAFTASQIWGSTYALVFRRPTSPNPDEPGLGRIWHYTGGQSRNARSNRGIEVDRYRESQTKSDIVQASEMADEVIHDANFGHLMQIES